MRIGTPRANGLRWASGRARSDTRSFSWRSAVSSHGAAATSRAPTTRPATLTTIVRASETTWKAVTTSLRRESVTHPEPAAQLVVFRDDCAHTATTLRSEGRCVDSPAPPQPAAKMPPQQANATYRSVGCCATRRVQARWAENLRCTSEGGPGGTGPVGEQSDAAERAGGSYLSVLSPMTVTIRAARGCGTNWWALAYFAQSFAW
jgi:hypothetical protein